ncbi:MAG: ribonuclease P protein component [bacterium]|nr:ribonuclease P protein component [bacterium]
MTSLSKIHRLASREVKLVFAHGEKEKGKGISLYCKKNNIREPRFAVVVSSKVAKKSVSRNRLRRQTKDVLYHFVSSIKRGYDIIIVFHMVFSHRKDIEDSIRSVLEKKSLLSGKKNT